MEVDFNKLVEGNKKQQYWVEKLKINRDEWLEILPRLKPGDSRSDRSEWFLVHRQ
jgi:hypothetical protein